MTEQQNTRRSFAGTAVLMGIIILAAKILGLVRDMLVAREYGTTSIEAIAYPRKRKFRRSSQRISGKKV